MNKKQGKAKGSWDNAAWWTLAGEISVNRIYRFVPAGHMNRFPERATARLVGALGDLLNFPGRLGSEVITEYMGSKVRLQWVLCLRKDSKTAAVRRAAERTEMFDKFLKVRKGLGLYRTAIRRGWTK